jgi:8-oxo-dGTP diphosphatase
MNDLHIVALATVRDGHVLVVRKRGAKRWMLPGGKREPGEAELDALARELDEELGVKATALRKLGEFSAPAANEPDTTVHGAIYVGALQGEPAARQEIEDVRWLSLAEPPSIPLAPLLETRVLPALKPEGDAVSLARLGR